MFSLGLVSVVVLASILDSSSGEVYETEASSVYVGCLRQWGQNLKRYTNIRARDETIEWECMQSYLWQTAVEREAPRNLSSRQTEFLRSLIKGPSFINRPPPATPRPPPIQRPLPIFGPLPIGPRNPIGPQTPIFVPANVRRPNPVPIFQRPVGVVRPQRVIAARTSARASRMAPRLRKEYRALTDAERTAFHNALNAAKNSLIMSPNAYDFVASMHTGTLAQGAHGGPAFLGWHRIYLIMLENLLRYFDSSVTLPFWDSSLDNELADPTQSIMWHSDFAGSGFGFVQTGPFSSWQTLAGTSISRNIGTLGSLMSLSDINNVLSQSYLSDISQPTASPTNNLEGHHGGVHGWVSGDMGSLNTATNDPVFFMHHAFIDCIWERFRNGQSSKGINPNTDYPNTFHANHRPTDLTNIEPGVRNKDAVGHAYASVATCEWPRCPQCGPSRYLECTNAQCVPIISDEVNPCPTCQDDNTNGYAGYQNTYCVNGYCDTGEWAYVPVQITYSRPPDYGRRRTYGSYPVVRGRAQFTYDIYNPRGYNQQNIYTARAARQNRSPRYTECGCRRNGANTGQVYVQSYGINYDGNYRESAVVDRRYAISSNVAYVAVRNPSKGASTASVSVYDDCGRLCRPTCWDSAGRRWRACSGTIQATTGGGNRRGYGNTYEEATYQVWDYGTRGTVEYPTSSQDNIYLNYFCDYSGTWPWDIYQQV